MILKGFAFFILISNVICEDIKTYKGYKLYDVVVKTLYQNELLRGLSESLDHGIDFLSHAKELNESSRVIIPPTKVKLFETLLQKNEIDFKVLDSDLSKSIEAEREENDNFQTRAPGKIKFSKYYNSYEINSYLDYLAMKYPKIVSVKTVGKSHEGRDIKTITISNDIKNSQKKIVFIDGGIHARERISPAMALYIIYQLVEKFDQNKHLLQNSDFVILPLVNPDGYDFSHDKERFWRKTRKPNKRCVGTDINRNFAFHWGEAGSSSDECHEAYRGPSSFSEVETRVLRDALLSLSGRAKMYLSLHSFGSYILYPWGYTKTRPETWDQINTVALAGATAIGEIKRKFKIGSQIELLYPSSGTAHDFALGVAKIPISMTMELPYSGDGFHPRPLKIEKIVSSIWPGIKAMAQTLDSVLPKMVM